MGSAQENAPLWLVRYGIGLWFCACAVAFAIVAARSL
jgi:hypothetical protein